MACGMVYCVTEYHVDITLCEGPSMMPTIRPSGEIVLIDKRSVRIYGLEDGCAGEDRAEAARRRQRRYEEAMRKNLRKRGRDGTGKKSRQKGLGNDEDGDMVVHEVWHRPYLSVSDKPPSNWREKVAQVFSPLSVGDVVVLHHPHRRGTVCKRVLGLPGDQVLHYRGLIVVPDGHLWVEGDNPSNSADSRQYGAVPAGLVLGRVVARIWPLRGRAWMERGGRPRQQLHDDASFDVDDVYYNYLHPPSHHGRSSGSTVLPAGYDGQQIVKRVPATAASSEQ